MLNLVPIPPPDVLEQLLKLSKDMNRVQAMWLSCFFIGVPKRDGVRRIQSIHKDGAHYVIYANFGR